EFFRYCRYDFAGGSIVGVVVAGKPVARVLVFALRPGLAGLVRIAGVGTDKVESAARLARVVDLDLDFIAGSERAWDNDPQLAVGGLEAGRLSAGSDCADL